MYFCIQNALLRIYSHWGPVWKLEYINLHETVHLKYKKISAFQTGCKIAGGRPEMTSSDTDKKNTKYQHQIPFSPLTLRSTILLPLSSSIAVALLLSFGSPIPWPCLSPSPPPPRDGFLAQLFPATCLAPFSRQSSVKGWLFAAFRRGRWDLGCLCALHWNPA